ncbi:hypothetical protein M422DRAFT_55200 [Sphaerobolus stellatus SS14]|uniref:Uncharacterized protein n=1 Tax=Sphaerobolus stellatus (strain SS14) TaxID=990650 RepID=A0A0C9TD30_SPHS4|nr:hypothetical protein M422DRAFT_55200 [Sphaerobolus stellatus SS14]
MNEAKKNTKNLLSSSKNSAISREVLGGYHSSSKYTTSHSLSKNASKSVKKEKESSSGQKCIYIRAVFFYPMPLITGDLAMLRVPTAEYEDKLVNWDAADLLVARGSDRKAWQLHKIYVAPKKRIPSICYLYNWNPPSDAEESDRLSGDDENFMVATSKKKSF